MPISLGSSAITAAYLGGNAISKIYLGIIQAWPTGSVWPPLDLFATGEQGAWYDPSDLTTLYQDSTGTTPVTAVEQLVVLMLDKSKGGVGTNGTKRVNLLSYTEDFGNAYWGKTRASATGNKISAATTGTQLYPSVTSTSLTSVSSPVQFTVEAKEAELRYISINLDNGAGSGFYYIVDTRDAAFIGSGFYGTGFSIVSAERSMLPDGYCRIKLTASGPSSFSVLISPSKNSTFTSTSYTVGEGMFARADLRLASEANTLPLYQKITSDWASTIAGNHAFQAVSTKRPTLSARVNLLTKTDTLGPASGWATYTGAYVGQYTTAPDGSNSGSLIKNVAASANQYYYYLISSSSGTHRMSVYAKADTGTNVDLFEYYTNSYNRVKFSLVGNGSVTSNTLGYNAGIIKDTRVSGWYYCFVDIPIPALGVREFNFVPSLVDTSVYLWGADLRVANDGVNLPAYQRVNAATDYDIVGFPKGDKFDGIDDFQITTSGGGGTSAFFFCAAIRAGKVGATQTLFSDTGTNTGYRVRINASNQLEFSAGNGSAYTTIATTATLAVGQRAVVTCWHDGVNLNAQINSGTVAQAAFATASAGTAQTTLGADNNAASSFFMGSIYESIYVKNDVLTAAQISSSQQYCATIGNITL